MKIDFSAIDEIAHAADKDPNIEKMFREQKEEIEITERLERIKDDLIFISQAADNPFLEDKERSNINVHVEEYKSIIGQLQAHKTAAGDKTE
jgi:hypothetical protein